MQTTFKKTGARVIGAAVAGAILLGSAGMVSAYGGTTVVVTNGAVVTNVSTASANTGFNIAGGGTGGSCGFFCSGGTGNGGIVTTGKAKAKTTTSNVVNTTSIKVK